MRYLIISCFILCLASCGSKETSTSSTSSSTTDTVQIQPVVINKQTSDSTHNPALDSTAYIGYVDYFSETNELSLLLAYSDDTFKPELDSLVYREEFNGTRKRVAKAEWKAFPLSGFDSITVYDQANKHIAEASFERVEFWENEMTSQFIAVFKTPNFKLGENAHYYCVSKNAHGFQNDFSYTMFDDAALTKTLLLKLNKDTTEGWIAQHYRLQPANIVYSTFSKEKESLITEYNGDVKVLMSLTDDFHVDKILPVPFFKQGKPLLLISASIPETDIFWESLAEYKDGKYVYDDYNRFKPE